MSSNLPVHMPDAQHKVKTAKQMAILQVVPRLQSGGAEQSTCEIADGLVRAGARSLVASAGGRLVERLEAEGSTVITIPADSKNPLIMAANVASLCRIIRNHDVALVHARSRAPAWSALAAARLCRVPFVTTFHGANRPDNTLKRSYNSVMARGDVTIANSNYTADLIRTVYGVDEQQMAVIHRGVDLHIFDPATISPERRKAMRARWGIAPVQPVIFVPARVTPIKGHETVIRALARLSDEWSDAVCVFAGDDQGHGGYVDGLRQLAGALGVSERVHFVGHCSDMPTAYASSDITLIASTAPEAFGRTAPEAQAMGSLVIATNLGGAVETVLVPPDVSDDGRTGWRVPPGDPAALANALGQVLALSPEQKDIVNTAARSRVQAAFSLHAMVYGTLKVYDRLLETDLATKYDQNFPAQ